MVESPPDAASSAANKKRKLNHSEARHAEDVTGRQVENIARLGSAIESGLKEPPEHDCIHQCGPTALSILNSRPDEVLQLAHEKLHTWPYRDVPTCWRRLYEEASLHKVIKLCTHAVVSGDSNLRMEVLLSPSTFRDFDPLVDRIISTLDMAIFLSGAPGREALIDHAFHILLISSPLDHPSTSGLKYKQPAIPELSTHYPIKRLSHPLDLESFQNHLDTAATPLIIPGQLDEWPAIDKWKDPAYLLKLTLNGRRLVPIELGRSYTDEGWSQTITKFGDFFHNHLIEGDNTSQTKQDQNPENEAPAPNRAPTAYLAQHDLFTQLPALRTDILIPDLCYTTPPRSTPASTKPVSQLDEPLLNAWLGPPGTQSPLHTDPYHNILAQPVGYKYVRLYAPEETRRLYPRGTDEMGVDMGNTSFVDIGGEVLGRKGGEVLGELWPEFKEAGFQEAVLGPGECLYIPVGWWHYVEGLSSSFSVSFWWN